MTLDDVTKLHQKRFRDELGYFLVEGEHLVLELQKVVAEQPALQGSRLYLTAAHAGWQSPFEKHVISDRQMARLSDTRSPQGIVAVVPVVPAPAPRAGERAIYLHEIQDPGNLGTILRSLAWFGGFRCLLGPGSVDPHNPKVVRASMGGIFHVPVEVDVSLEAVRQRFARIALLDLQGTPLGASGFSDSDCHVFGNEARGLPVAVVENLHAQVFSVPGCGAIDSLNLATVVNLCAYELTRCG